MIYFAQMKYNNVWIDLNLSSRSMSELIGLIDNYIKINGTVEYRIVQKSEAEIKKGKKNAGCC